MGGAGAGAAYWDRDKLTETQKNLNDPRLAGGVQREFDMKGYSTKAQESINLGLKVGTPEFNRYMGTTTSANGITSTYDPRTNTVSAPNGAVQTVGDYTSAQENAKASVTNRNEMVDVPQSDGTVLKMTKENALRAAGGNPSGSQPSTMPTNGNSNISGAFTNSGQSVLNQINAIKDPTERAGALQAYNTQFNTQSNPQPNGLSTGQSTFQKASQTKTGEASAASGQAYQDDLNSKVNSEREMVMRNNRILPLLDEVHTGGFGADTRATLANNLMNSDFVPDSVKPKIGQWLNTGDPAKAKVVENQLAGAAVTQMLDLLKGDGAKPNRAIFQALRSAQEDSRSGNATLKQVFDIQKNIYDNHYSEQQAITKAIKDGTYDPRTWAGDYSATLHEGLSSPSSTSQPSPLGQNSQTFSNLQSATQLSGKRIKAEDGTILRSNGKQWIRE